MESYQQFPLVEKSQKVAVWDKQNSHDKAGYVYSKTIFTMISENDAIGKTRFEYIQDRWEGGDTNGRLYEVNQRKDYIKIVEELSRPKKAP